MAGVRAVHHRDFHDRLGTSTTVDGRCGQCVEDVFRGQRMERNSGAEKEFHVPANHPRPLHSESN